ncbi:MAG TPA: peptidase M13, partial [Bacillota bacterium]|nr:peptidase M13 [Bacillota bacterium]
MTVSDTSRPDHPSADRPSAGTTPRPQDDLFGHVNGSWLAAATIPDDKPSAGAFDELRDEAEEAVRDIITGLAEDRATLDGEQAKIADLYASFMDLDRVEALGTTPLEGPLAEVDAVRSAGELLALTG